jgi:hypothetical protein
MTILPVPARAAGPTSPTAPSGPSSCCRCRAGGNAYQHLIIKFLYLIEYGLIEDQPELARYLKNQFGIGIGALD